MKNLAILLMSILSIGFTSSLATAVSDCDRSIKGFEKIIREQGGSIEAYYDCLKADRNCLEEAKDAVYDGYSSETLIMIVESVSAYKVCKIYED